MDKYKNLGGNDERLPDLWPNKDDCCGCTACWAICPVSAIEMSEDEEGFLYPVIDASKCIRCHKCLKICAFKTDKQERWSLHE